MNIDDIKDRVRFAVRTLLPGVSVAAISDGADIFDLGVDSVHAMSLVTTLQEEFDLEFDEDDVDVANFQSVEAIARLIADKLHQTK